MKPVVEALKAVLATQPLRVRALRAEAVGVFDVRAFTVEDLSRLSICR